MTRARRGLSVLLTTHPNARIHAAATIADEVYPEKLAVADVMSFELATVREQDGVWETIEFMRAKGVRRIPVLAADGTLAGIVTVDDLLELLSGELNALAGTVRREQIKETRARR